jgi:molybdopterin molybdotransferase
VRPLIGLEEARARVLERCVPLASESVPLVEALGRTLAADVVSARSVPGFDGSAMDGFAIRSIDTARAKRGRPAVLRLAGESRAGHMPTAAVGHGEAAAISTGGMMPDGADAVVPIEDTAEAAGGIEITRAVASGTYVRHVGDDIPAGQIVLRRATTLGPFELAVLASILDGPVACARRPRLRMVFTGDELARPGDPPTEGSVRNTNWWTLPGLARLAGATVEGCETIGDDRAATQAAIEAAADADVIVISGGVSVGTHDHVRPALGELGAEEVFWGIALRPGRPTWFGLLSGSHERTVLVFGLPGNPVSAVVTFLLLARPCLQTLVGADPETARITATLTSDYEKRPGRAHAVRCRLVVQGDGWHAEPTGPQDSHILTSMLGADGLAMIPAESGDVRAGSRVTVELLPRFAPRLA